MLTRLRQIEMQEDIWFFCLDTLKWDTKKIVCDRAYLTEQELLSSMHITQLQELSRLEDKDERDDA
jgi:4-hydroxy-4-methyl-2-oxoglutarate aldolase